MNQESNKLNDSSPWPYSSLFLFGYFGKESPGGKTLFNRNMIGALLCAFGIILSPVVEHPLLVIPVITLIPSSVLLIMWAYKEYLLQLDELSRMIQYESFAFAYGIAMAIGLTLYSIGFPFNTTFPAIWILFAEGLRGLALTRIAKKYA